MGNTKRRLAQIEAAEVRLQRQLIAAIAAEHGLTVDEFLEEAEQFFALSLPEQLAEVDRVNAELRAQGMSMEDIDEIKETLIKKNRA